MANKEGVFHPATCNYYKETDWDKIRTVLTFRAVLGTPVAIASI